MMGYRLKNDKDFLYIISISVHLRATVLVRATPST